MYEEDRENREDRDQEIERTEIMDDVGNSNQFIPVTGKRKVRFFTECKLDYPKTFF